MSPERKEEKMKILIAMDSFKGSLSSRAAGEAAKRGIQRVYKDAQITVRALADGGEGTLDALVSGMGARYERMKASNPLGKEINVKYGISESEKTAIIEMAEAAGLTLLKEEEKNPLYTTTYGVGEMIRDAISKGCRKFIIGIGGSASNDGGAGMLRALGYRLRDKRGGEIPFGAIGLQDLDEIEDKEALAELKECSFRIACDVANPLCGENGCSEVYAPQKGADKTALKKMDLWLLRYANKVKKLCPHADPDYPGAGAAGGLGFAFLSFMNAKLVPGIEIVMEESGLLEEIRDADLIITGEGRLDGQSLMGKAPIGIAGRAKRFGKKVIAFAGCLGEDAELCNRYGIDAFFPILRDIANREEAMKEENAARNMASAAEQAFRLIKLFGD